MLRFFPTVHNFTRILFSKIRILFWLKTWFLSAISRWIKDNAATIKATDGDIHETHFLRNANEKKCCIFSRLFGICALISPFNTIEQEKKWFPKLPMWMKQSRITTKNDYNVLAKGIVVIFASAIQFCNYQTTRIHSHFEMQLIELKYFSFTMCYINYQITPFAVFSFFLHETIF